MAPQWRDDLNAALGASRAAQAAGDTVAAMQYANQAMAAAQTGPARRAASEALNAAMAPGLQRYDEQMAQLFQPPAAEPAPGGPVGDAGGGETEQDRYYAWRRQQDINERAEMQRQERATASSFLRGILEQYGMGSLASQVENLVGTWGTNVDVIAENLRQTQEYKTRFKGLVQLQQKGITDIRNEADYLQLETNYRQVFREAGLRDFLGQSGTQAEYDAIAKLVGDFSLSVNEVRARVADAQRVAAESPPEVRQALRDYYGVDSADLVAYTLDPVRTATRINEKANAAILGGYAARAGLQVGAGAAERLVGGVGEQDIEVGAVQQELSQAREVRDATRRLAEIEQSILTDEEVLESRAGTDIEAGQKIRTLQSRERARFGGQAGLSSRSLSRSSGV